MKEFHQLIHKTYMKIKRNFYFYQLKMKNKIALPPVLPDHKLKPLQRFYRPYFSPYTDSYEIDYVFGPKIGEKFSQIYLACININTKYLFMIPVKGRSIEETASCVRQIDETISNTFPGSSILYIRGDSDSSFGKIVEDKEDVFYGLGELKDIIIGNLKFKNNAFTKYLQVSGKSLFLSKSPFTNKNRVIDRAIRTIRDRLGENYLLFANPKIVLKAVEEYNNTPHSAFNHEFTPKQVQSYHELEEYYIRQQMKRLDEVKGIQQGEGLFSYKPGNILLIHLNLSKTEEKLRKKRRVFNRLAAFHKYNNGNVICSVLERYDGKTIPSKLKYGNIEIPIFYTKFLCDNISEIPNDYKQLIL